MAVTITQGTQTGIKTTTDGGNGEVQHIRADGGTVALISSLNQGTVRVSVGTVTAGTLTNLISGTINAIAAGTITNGTVLTQGLHHADAFATVVSTGTLTLGTIKPAVSGSSIYVTDLIISAGSATNVEIASGGTSTPILGTLHLNANGGAVMNFQTPLKTVAGSALTFKQSAAISPLSITALGYVD